MEYQSKIVNTLADRSDTDLFKNYVSSDEELVSYLMDLVYEHIQSRYPDFKRDSGDIRQDVVTEEDFVLQDMGYSEEQIDTALKSEVAQWIKNSREQVFTIAQMIQRNEFDQLDNVCVAFEQFLANTLNVPEGKLDFTLKRFKDHISEKLRERAQNLSESLQKGSEGLPAMTTGDANEAAAVFYTLLAEDRKGEVLTFDPKQRRKRPK